MASLLKRFRRYLRRRRDMPRRSIFSRITRFLKRVKKQQATARGKSRRRKRLAWGGVWLLALSFLVGGLAYLSHLDEMEIQQVTVTGNSVVDTEDITSVINETLAGRYLYLFSERNIIIYPKSRIQANLQSAFPRLADISLARESLTDIIVSVSEREPHALWCGKERLVDSATNKRDCYFLDETGYIFAPAPHFTGDVFFTYYGTSTSPDNDPRPSSPLNNTYLSETLFKRVNALIAGFTELGFTPISLTQLNGIDFAVHFANGGQILFRRDQKYTQVLENLQSVLRSDAFQKERQERDIERIDLRFGNKIYYTFQ